MIDRILYPTVRSFDVRVCFNFDYQKFAMQNLDFIKAQISGLEEQILKLQGNQILQAYFNDILIQTIAELTNSDVYTVRKSVADHIKLRGEQQLSNVDSTILDHWLRTQIKPL